MTSLRLVIVRHGETAWTRERRYTGSRDIPLTPDGLRQAGAVAQALRGSPVTAVVSSPLARTRASAEAIAGPHGLPVTLAPEFRELTFGAWEGLTRDEVAERFPAEYAQWQVAPHLVTLPDGEPVPAAVERVTGALDRLRAAHREGMLVLVTHGIVIRLIVLGALGLGPERLWSVDASPAGITEIEYQPDWTTMHRMNTLSHLNGRRP